MRHELFTKTGATLISALTILILAVPTAPYSLSNKPIAIGFGDSTRYILYSSGYVYAVSTIGETPIGRIDLSGEPWSNLESFIIDFEVYNEVLYLYAYRSINASAGETLIVVYNLSSGERIFEKKYEFNVVDSNEVRGDMVLTAIASPRGLAVLLANTTHSLIEVYGLYLTEFKQLAIYSGRMAMSIYRFNDTLIAATFKVEFRNQTPWVTPQVTDLFRNETLFTLPALIPVAALVYPFIQVFNRGGLWECYVTVYNQLMNRMEYYLVYPEGSNLIDYVEARVSPYMDYAIIEHQEGSKIMFRDGVNMTIDKRLSIVPQGAFIPLDPKNGVLDIDLGRKAVLAKVVEGESARIIYVVNNHVVELYKLEALKASKAWGFYAALVGDKAYLINPETGELMVFNLEEGGKKPQEFLQPTIMIIVGSIAACIAVAAAITVRMRRHARS
ncbi:MAG: hypothetical protein QW224_02635 [Desulfurococcaceae archaeon]